PVNGAAVDSAGVAVAVVAGTAAEQAGIAIVTAGTEQKDRGQGRNEHALHRHILVRGVLEAIGCVARDVRLAATPRDPAGSVENARRPRHGPPARASITAPPERTFPHPPTSRTGSHARPAVAASILRSRD